MVRDVVLYHFGFGNDVTGYEFVGYLVTFDERIEEYTAFEVIEQASSVLSVSLAMYSRLTLPYLLRDAARASSEVSTWVSSFLLKATGWSKMSALSA